MLKNTSIGGVSKEIFQFEWGVVAGQHLGQQWPARGSRDCKGLKRHNFLNISMNGAREVFIGI